MVKRICHKLTASLLLVLFDFSFNTAPATFAVSKTDVRSETQKFID